MTNQNAISVPPKQIQQALAHVAAGGRLMVATVYRVWLIDARCLAKWEATGKPLLREEGDGYRMRQGKSSVYLMAGQLKMIR